MGVIQLLAQSLTLGRLRFMLTHFNLTLGSYKSTAHRPPDGFLFRTLKNDKKGPHRNAAPSLGISLARLEFAI
jgi:hypothetical protein